MLAEGLLLLHMGRGLSFFFDDWDYVTHDFGGGIHSLLVAHNGHCSLLPVVIYKLLFHLVGLNHYAVFRLVVIALHLLSAGLLFVLASRRMTRAPALLFTALLLFLGAAWEDLLWGFQMSYLLSIAGGLGAWVLLDRDDRPGDVGAMCAVALGLASSGLGIPVLVGVAVELAWQRQWRRGFIVVIPALFYVAWYLHYGENQLTANGLINAPGFTEDLIASAFGALVGRGLDWGRPLALLGVLVLMARLLRPLSVSARLVGLLATGFSFWVLTATSRSTISSPETSRYLYFGAVVILLVAVELLRDYPFGARLLGVSTLVVTMAAITGLTLLHSGAGFLRENSRIVAAELGALELGAANAAPGFQPDAHFAPQIAAGDYLHTVRAIGSSPADTPQDIVDADSTSRAAADRVLVALGIPRLTRLTGRGDSRWAPAPVVAGLSGGRLHRSGSCLDLKPLPGVAMTITLTSPPRGVSIRDQGLAATSMAVRRFGEPFDQLPTSVAPHEAGKLSLSTDRSVSPWQLQLRSTSKLRVCGLPT